MQFVIKTQTLENYGAHSESGRYADGNAYWKFKGGTTYIVSDCERVQDAAAFVMAAFGENGVGWKEYPAEYLDIHEWIEELEADDEPAGPPPVDGYLETEPHHRMPPGARSERRKSGAL